MPRDPARFGFSATGALDVVGQHRVDPRSLADTVDALARVVACPSSSPKTMP